MRILALAALLAGLCGCMGPRPVVVESHLKAPQAPGAPYVLVVFLRNDGYGEGQVELTARLLSRRRGETAGQCIRQVALRARETVEVVLEFRGVPPGDYRAAVEAVYPP